MLKLKEFLSEIEAMKAELVSIEYEIEQEERRLNGIGLQEKSKEYLAQSIPSPNQASSNSKMDDLRYLTDMLKEGFLSHEEFKREKKKLLGN